MTIFAHVLANLQLLHDQLLHVNDDVFDNRYTTQDFDEYYRLLIQSRIDQTKTTTFDFICYLKELKLSCYN